MSDPSVPVTVIIPTYKRPDLLRRAVDSVLNQSFTDWELIVSDDESPGGQTWSYLQSLRDPRVRITQNPGPHGQCGNVSHAMKLARGEWIKFLYDDDAVRPQCLAAFLQAVADKPGVICASCAVAEYREGKLFRSGESSGPLLTLIPQRFLLLGMYLQEDIGFGVPTQMMIRRTVVDRGILFDPHPGLRSGVDSYFCARVAQLGDSLIIRAPLVEFYQGGHESITSTMDMKQLDEEFKLLRRIQLPMIDPALKPPPLATVYQMLNLIRATSRASRKQFAQAAALTLSSWRPGAWRLFFQWLRRRRNPDLHSNVQRITCDDSVLRKTLSIAL
jgi:glycosyltransferase involved in cell wall biosynthesis